MFEIVLIAALWYKSLIKVWLFLSFTEILKFYWGTVRTRFDKWSLPMKRYFIFQMLRRPPTEIVLKLEEIDEMIMEIKKQAADV